MGAEQAVPPSRLGSPSTPPLSTNSRYDDILQLARQVAAHDYNWWSPEAREDLVSEVMIKYWQKWDRGPGPDNPRAWLRVATRNTAINLHAARQRRPELLVAGGGEGHDTDSDGLLDSMFANVRRQRLPTPSTIVVDRKMLHRVLRLVAKPQRRLIQMKYLDNLSAAEIAAALGMSLDSVNQAVSRAKRALGKELSDRPDLIGELRNLPTAEGY